MNTVPLSLYVHLPWCIKKCPYCDFNSHEIKHIVPEDHYINALITNLCSQTHYIQEREIISVFIGGGTPSIFSAKSIKRLILSIRDHLILAKGAEVSIEANPGTLDQKNFAGFREAGINRISIGVQSFTNSHLNNLGRIHNADAAIKSVRVAKQVGFENINIDLMFALPEQTLAMALTDVEQAIDLDPTHISYYQLTLEPNTRFYRHPPQLPNSQLSWDIQQAGMELLSKHGFQQYEVSAYARNGYQCVHNTNYWQFGDYLGIGAGAHQKLSISLPNKIVRSENAKHPQQYMKEIHENKSLVPTYTLNEQDIIFEFMLNALRLKHGFNQQQFELHTGIAMKKIHARVQRLVKDNLLISDGKYIRCSNKGYRFLDNVLQHLLPQESAA